MRNFLSTDSEQMGDLFSDTEQSPEQSAEPTEAPAPSANVPRWPNAKALLGDRRVASALRTAFRISAHPGAEFEQGGIISMHRTSGKLHIEFRTDREKTATGLNKPVVPAGYVVVANFHTHPNLPRALEQHRRALPYVDKYLTSKEALQAERSRGPSGAASAELSAGDAELPPSTADLENAKGRKILSLVVTYPTNPAFRRNNLETLRGAWEEDDADLLLRGSVFAYGQQRRTQAYPVAYPGVTSARRNSLPHDLASIPRKDESDPPESYDGRWQLHGFDLDA